MVNSCIPPHISQFYDAKLLQRPMPKMHEDSVELLRVYQFIEKRARKKRKYGVTKAIKFGHLCRKFEELYERAIEKEEELRASKKNHGKGWYYFHSGSNTSDDEIFGIIERKALRVKSNRRNHAI